MEADGRMREYTYEILFESEADHWWLSSRRAMVLDWIAERYGRRGGGLQILDVGCGTGLLMREMAQLGEVRGVDVSEEALRFCRGRGLTGVQLADVAALPFADSTFDLLTGVDILEHLDDDVGALTEWKRVLKPGGRLFLFVPAHRWLWSLQDDISGHRRRYTAGALKQAMRAAGFRLERLSYASTFLFPVIVVGRLWLKVLRRFRDVRSENTLHPAWSNGLLRRVFRAEIPVLRRVNLPFGSSILCVARKDGG